MTANVDVHGRVAFKGRRDGKKRPFIEGKWGDDLHRLSGVWNRLRRVIDRENDRYVEKIEAPDGTVLRDVDEPLPEHRGHGSAKRQD